MSCEKKKQCLTRYKNDRPKIITKNRFILKVLFTVQNILFQPNYFFLNSNKNTTTLQQNHTSISK